jgi:phosphoribosylformylglycinamidine synthase
MSMGERTPLAALDAPASGRMAVAEAITNLLAAPDRAAARQAQSANWMAACGEAGRRRRALRHRASAVGLELCPALGIGDPGGQGLAVHAHALDGERRRRPSRSPRRCR